MLDANLIEPTANFYSKGDPERLPGKTRNRVRNFFVNMHGPIDITNNLLQGKFKKGFSGIGRLLVNTTIGLGGLFDPAAKWGMPQYREDFGQTLATWGIPHGPYLYVPLFGPRSLRDLVGLAIDWQLSPVIQNDDTATRNTLFALGLIDRRTDVYVLEYFRAIEDHTYEDDRDDYVNMRWSEAYFDGDAPVNFDIY